MSRSWRRDRARLFAGEPSPAEAIAAADGPNLVGRDFSTRRNRKGVAGTLIPLLVGGLAATLLLTSVRVQVIRLRYELADALAREGQLLDDKRTHQAALSTLHSPKRLREEAGRLGLVRPDRVIDLSAAKGRPSAADASGPR